MARAQPLVAAQPNVDKLVEDHLAVQSLIRAYQVRGVPCSRRHWGLGQSASRRVLCPLWLPWEEPLVPVVHRKGPWAGAVLGGRRAVAVPAAGTRTQEVETNGGFGDSPPMGEGQGRGVQFAVSPLGTGCGACLWAETGHLAWEQRPRGAPETRVPLLPLTSLQRGRGTRRTLSPGKQRRCRDSCCQQGWRACA